MPVSKREKEFVAYVVELMQPMSAAFSSPVLSKSMFGGHGIFLEGCMFGLVADSTLYLKVDQETEDDFLARNLEPFTYGKKGKTLKMSYYQAPEEALDNAKTMCHWACKAHGVAMRATMKKKTVTKKANRKKK